MSDEKHAITVAGKPFDLAAKQLQVPKYKFSAKLPLAGAQFLNMGVGSTAQAIFEIDPNVVNLSQCVLSYQRIIADQGVGKFAVSHQETIPEISQLQFYTRNKSMLLDIPDVAKYLKVVRPRETRLTDYLSHDGADVGLVRSNLPAALNPMAVAGTGTFAGSVNYSEPLHMRFSPAVGTGAGGAGELSEKIDFRLGNLLNTIFSINKDLAFSEVMVLRVVFRPDKVGFSSTSNVIPAGTLALASGTTSAGGGAGGVASCVFIAGLTLLVAVEQRADVVAMRMKQLDGGGYTVKVPYVWVEQQSLQGANVQLSVKLDSQHGQFLRKVYSTVFPSDDSKEVAFDNSNLPVGAYAATPVGSKINAFLTKLDGFRLQEIDYSAVMDPTPGLLSDYIDQKSLLKGSVIETRRQHYANWAYCDDWTNSNPLQGMAPAEAMGGIDLKKGMRTYIFNATATTNPNTALVYFCFFITQRTLHVTKNLITIE
ncbi:MAG: hypothetical protein NT176_09050 [Proteobacteria bacterium]|nr:hypothetical protein [Pseudomonadota bacterium]